MASRLASKIFRLAALIAAPPTAALATSYQIDEGLSYIEIVPSAPGDAALDPVLTEGTFFADVGAVVDQASILSTSMPFFPFFDTVYATIGPPPDPLTSMRTQLTGELLLTPIDGALQIDSGSLLDASENPNGPFEPQFPFGGEDNFGAAAVGPDNLGISGRSAVLGQIAVRDVNATLVGGRLTPGRPASESAFELLLTRGFLDYTFDPDVLALLDVDPALASGSFELTDLASAALNESSELIVQGDDGSLTIPFESNFPFVLLDTREDPNGPPLPDDSQLALRGVIVASPVAQPGDINGDGRVDAADYTVWRDSEGSFGPGLPADISGDGLVDIVDYDLWRENYGAGQVAAAVPEPRSIVLLTALLIAFPLGNTARYARIRS